MVQMNYITILKNWIYGYDRYLNQYSKTNLKLSSYPDRFFLLKEDELSIGLEKVSKLQEKTGGDIIRIETNIPDHLLNKNIKNGKGWYINQNWIEVTKVYLYRLGIWEERSIEDITALSFLLDDPTSWDSIKPRSFSYLPISQACQASCKFCFSDYSISSEPRMTDKNYAMLNDWLVYAKANQAERFVLTGGGEPGLLPLKELETIFKMSSKYFKKNVMITNGIFLQKHDYTSLNRLHDSGLNIISLSVHHFDMKKNKMIMGVDTKFESALEKIKASNLHNRLICVLQKKGISTFEDISNYLDFAILNNVEQVTFKELYISSIYETKYALSKENKYSILNRVPLQLVLDFALLNNLEQIGSLPWGSPIFKYKGISFCAYTEPSVGWEKHNKIARSWNLMSDNKCYASLEDPNSTLLFKRINYEL